MSDMGGTSGKASPRLSVAKSAATTSLVHLSPRLAWTQATDDIRPYVYVRPENQVPEPGKRHKLDWFPVPPVCKNPLEMSQVSFADDILSLESSCFEEANMAMPRWVFYDCAVVPGFVAGFAHRTETLSSSLRQVLRLPLRSVEAEWTPISLFIIIPTMSRKEWVAHNLCSVNSLLDPSERFYGLGFLTKAFGLWYANVEVNIGMTQWESPSVKLHSHYGYFEVLTAFTPVHSYAQTLTYRLRPQVEMWPQFFNHKESDSFLKSHINAGFTVDPRSKQSLVEFQGRIERGEGPFFLDSHEIRHKQLGTSYHVFKPLAQ